MSVPAQELKMVQPQLSSQLLLKWHREKKVADFQPSTAQKTPGTCWLKYSLFEKC